MEMSEIYNGSQWAHDIFLVNKDRATEYITDRSSTLIVTKKHSPSFKYHEPLSEYIIGPLTFIVNIRHYHSFLASIPSFLHHICTLKCF